MSSFHRGHACSIPLTLFPQHQQPLHPPPGPTSFPYKLPSPWQLAERGHYIGDISDRRWKAGGGPSALHQRTSGFHREHCACLLDMHSVSISCSVSQKDASQRQIISFRLPAIVHTRQASFTYCPVLVFGLSPSSHFHPVVAQPILTDTTRSISPASTHQVSSQYYKRWHGWVGCHGQITLPMGVVFPVQLESLFCTQCGMYKYIQSDHLQTIMATQHADKSWLW